ncbi:MAG: nitrilase-related carbon-nitrogen hydrolase [Candidatus Aminicenantales bacterium]
MKVALAQISPRLGDLRKNLDLHLEFIEKARRRKAGLIIFPELSLTGYTLMDLVPDVAVEPARHPLFRKLVAASRSIDIVVGFLEEKEKGLFTNSAAYLAGGKISHLHRKVFLPTGGMFEEAKFFGRGRNFRTFSTSFGKTGLMICRDFLSYGACYLLFADGVDILIVISAAPGRGMTEGDAFATSRMWELMGEAISFFSTAFVLYCNRVGIEDGKMFAGGSFVFGPDGRRLAKAAEMEEELILADLRLGDIRSARKRWTFKRDEQPEIILHGLERIVRDDDN